MDFICVFLPQVLAFCIHGVFSIMEGGSRTWIPPSLHVSSGTVQEGLYHLHGLISTDPLLQRGFQRVLLGFLVGFFSFPLAVASVTRFCIWHLNFCLQFAYSFIYLTLRAKPYVTRCLLTFKVLQEFVMVFFLQLYCDFLPEAFASV